MLYQERAQYIRKKLGFSQAEFADKLEVAQTLISMIERGTRQYSKKSLQRFEKVFPQVNIQWLKTGEGEAIKQGTIKASDEETPIYMAGPVQPTNKPEFKASAGERGLNYGNKSLDILVIAVDNNNDEQVVVVPEYALAGYTEGYRDPEFIRELPTEPVPHDLKGRGTIRKFQVYGDSMEPAVRHRDYVYCSYVEIRNPMELTQKIRNGYLYVVNSTRGPLIKKLYYRDGDQFIQCVSRNKAYPPFNLHLSEIRELWYWRRRYSGHLEDNDDVILDGIRSINDNVIHLGEEINELTESITTGFKQLKVGGK